MNRLLFLCFISFVLLFVGACSSHKKIGVTTPENQIEDTVATWTAVEMPVRMELTAPSRFSISGKAKMIRSQAISISLRKIGFEVARLYATPDSLYIVSGPLNMAYAESMQRITTETRMNFEQIQLALLGQAEIPQSRVNFQFSDPIQTECGMAFAQVNVSAMVSERTISGKLQWKVAEAKWNQPCEIRAPRISEDYRRVDTAALLRMLKSL